MRTFTVLAAAAATAAATEEVLLPGGAATAEGLLPFGAPPPKCTVGEPCNLPEFAKGTCQKIDGAPKCVPPPKCNVGEPCKLSESAKGTLAEVLLPGVALGDGNEGTCQKIDGAPKCAPPPKCTVGDTCNLGDDNEGTCQEIGGAAKCAPPPKSCTVGDKCQLPDAKDGTEGTCQKIDGAAKCAPPPKCTVGDTCNLRDGNEGTCQKIDGAPKCAPPPKCTVGDTCELGDGTEGTCQQIDGAPKCACNLDKECKLRDGTEGTCQKIDGAPKCEPTPEADECQNIDNAATCPLPPNPDDNPRAACKGLKGGEQCTAVLDGKKIKGKCSPLGLIAEDMRAAYKPAEVPGTGVPEVPPVPGTTTEATEGTAAAAAAETAATARSSAAGTRAALSTTDFTNTAILKSFVLVCVSPGDMRKPPKGGTKLENLSAETKACARSAPHEECKVGRQRGSCEQDASMLLECKVDTAGARKHVNECVEKEVGASCKDGRGECVKRGTALTCAGKMVDCFSEHAKQCFAACEGKDNDCDGLTDGESCSDVKSCFGFITKKLSASTSKVAREEKKGQAKAAMKGKLKGAAKAEYEKSCPECSATDFRKDFAEAEEKARTDAVKKCREGATEADKMACATAGAADGQEARAAAKAQRGAASAAADLLTTCKASKKECAAHAKAGFVAAGGDVKMFARMKKQKNSRDAVATFAACLKGASIADTAVEAYGKEERDVRQSCVDDSGAEPGDIEAGRRLDARTAFVDCVNESTLELPVDTCTDEAMAAFTSTGGLKYEFADQLKRGLGEYRAELLSNCNAAGTTDEKCKAEVASQMLKLRGIVDHNAEAVEAAKSAARLAAETLITCREEQDLVADDDEKAAFTCVDDAVAVFTAAGGVTPANADKPSPSLRRLAIAAEENARVLRELGPDVVEAAKSLITERMQGCVSKNQKGEASIKECRDKAGRAFVWVGGNASAVDEALRVGAADKAAAIRETCLEETSKLAKSKQRKAAQACSKLEREAIKSATGKSVSANDAKKLQKSRALTELAGLQKACVALKVKGDATILKEDAAEKCKLENKEANKAAFVKAGGNSRDFALAQKQAPIESLVDEMQLCAALGDATSDEFKECMAALKAKTTGKPKEFAKMLKAAREALLKRKLAPCDGLEEDTNERESCRDRATAAFTSIGGSKKELRKAAQRVKQSSVGQAIQSCRRAAEDGSLQSEIDETEAESVSADIGTDDGTAKAERRLTDAATGDAEQTEAEAALEEEKLKVLECQKRARAAAKEQGVSGKAFKRARRDAAVTEARDRMEACTEAGDAIEKCQGEIVDDIVASGGKPGQHKKILRIAARQAARDAAEVCLEAGGSECLADAVAAYKAIFNDTDKVVRAMLEEGAKKAFSETLDACKEEEGTTEDECLLAAGTAQNEALGQPPPSQAEAKDAQVGAGASAGADDGSIGLEDGSATQEQVVRDAIATIAEKAGVDEKVATDLLIAAWSCTATTVCDGGKSLLKIALADYCCKRCTEEDPLACVPVQVVTDVVAAVEGLGLPELVGASDAAVACTSTAKLCQDPATYDAEVCGQEACVTGAISGEETDANSNTEATVTGVAKLSLDGTKEDPPAAERRLSSSRRLQSGKARPHFRTTDFRGEPNGRVTGNGRFSAGSFTAAGDFTLDVDAAVDSAPQVEGKLTVSKRLTMQAKGSSSGVIAVEGALTVCDPEDIDGDEAGGRLRGADDCAAVCEADEVVAGKMQACRLSTDEDEDEEGFAPVKGGRNGDCRRALKACVGTCSSQGLRQARLGQLKGAGSVGVCANARLRVEDLATAVVAVQLDDDSAGVSIDADRCRSDTRIEVDLRGATAASAGTTAASALRCRAGMKLGQSTWVVRAGDTGTLRQRRIVRMGEARRLAETTATATAANLISFKVYDAAGLDISENMKLCCYDDGQGLDLAAASADDCPTCVVPEVADGEVLVVDDDGELKAVDEKLVNDTGVVEKEKEKEKTKAPETVTLDNDSSAAVSGAIAAAWALFIRW